MPLLATRIFDHGGRRLEIRAEVSDTDPTYLEATVWEGERLVPAPGPDGRLQFPVYGVNFLAPIGLDDSMAVDTLMDAAERDYRLRLGGSRVSATTTATVVI